MSTLTKYLIILILALPNETLAHEGHGIVPNGVLHYIFASEHVFVLTLVVLLLISIVTHTIKKHKNA